MRYICTGITTVGILTVTGRVKIGGDLDSGDITYDEITGRNLNITGVSTLKQHFTSRNRSGDGDVFTTLNHINHICWKFHR